MLKNPLTYACIVFFAACMGFTPARGADLEPEAVYCNVSSSRSQGTTGFWGFIKETLSCKVKVDYEIEEIYLDGNIDVEVTYENSEALVEKLRGWFSED